MSEREGAEGRYDPCDREPRPFSELCTGVAQWEYFTRPTSHCPRIPTTAHNPATCHLQVYCRVNLGSWDIPALIKLSDLYLLATSKTVAQIEATPLTELARHFGWKGVAADDEPRKETQQSDEVKPAAGAAPAWTDLGEAKRAILTVLNRSTERLQGGDIAGKAGYAVGTLRHHFGPLQSYKYIDKTHDGYAITSTGAALVPCD